MLSVRNESRERVITKRVKTRRLSVPAVEWCDVTKCVLMERDNYKLTVETPLGGTVLLTLMQSVG